MNTQQLRHVYVPWSWLWVVLTVSGPLTATQAQVRISGEVTYNGISPVAAANVTIEGTYDGGTTDKKGKFSFVAAELGTYTLRIEAPGFVHRQQPLVLADTLPVRLRLELNEKLMTLAEIMVRPRVFANADRNLASNLKPLDVLTTATDGSIATTLKSMPGAQQIGESADLFVRGGTGSETRTFMDGLLIRSYNQSGVSGVATRSRYPTQLFKGTVFSTGGYSAQYGQALSSVLLLETQDIPVQSNAELTLSPLMGGATIQQILPSKTAVVGGGLNYTNLNWVLNWMPNQSLQLSPAPESVDGNLYYRQKLPRQGMLKAFVNWGASKTGIYQNNLDYVNTLNRVRVDNRNLYGNLSYRQSIGRGWKLQAGSAWNQNADETTVQVTQDNQPRSVYTGQQHTQIGQARAVLSKSVLNYSTLHIGSEWFYTREQTQDSGRVQSYVDVYRSAFAEMDWYVNEQVSVRVGGRYEQSTLTNRQALAPRLSLGYTFANNGLLSFSYGTFYQQPDREFLFQQHDLDMARARHTILSYQRMDAFRSFRVELYHKSYTGLIRTRPDTTATGTGYARGFELFWRDKKTLKDIDYWISYSFLDTERQFMAYPMRVQPGFAARHTASVVAKRFFSKITTNVGLTYSVASGRPYYNPTRPDDRFMQDRTPVYHNLGLSVAYLPKIKIKQAYSVVVLTVSNVLGNGQIYGYRYGTLDTSRREAIRPVANPFVFLGMFLNFGIDRRQDTINAQL
ncbi:MULTISPECIES: TonB-dependent receptor [Spirosoma]|uniref:TonB-dependent receptor n=1 Tax=Spirosoma sordidisoli TaxID=2502893 RepID=A0A4Q2UH00_9BACT|nr:MULTISPECIES: carboxypeptidase-like regulatory domain-containing protein [Spirosoma]RYC68444.1 TonB-dependent receptor [Spirosoma sordidisoli]